MNKKGFTIIEILIVTVVIGMMIPIVFTVMFSVIRQEARVFALNLVKTQGDFVLNSMKVTIRNSAISTHSANPGTTANEVCTSVSTVPAAQDPLVLMDRDGNSFYYSVNGGAVASNSSVLAEPTMLTNLRVSITNFTMSCNKPTSSSSPVVTVSYTVNYTTTAGQSPATLDYQTKIKLRNQ